MNKTFSQKQTKCSLLSLFVSFVAFCSTLSGADFNRVKIPSVTVTVSDFTLDYSPASKEVALRPASGGTIRTGTSDADGIVNFTRVTPGLYTLTIAAIGMDPLTLEVPNTTNTYAASALVISAWTPPSGARYAGATANLQAWSLIAPSTKQDAGVTLDQISDPTGNKVFDMHDTYLDFDTGLGTISFYGTNSDYTALVRNDIYDVSAGSNPPLGEALDLYVASHHTNGTLTELDGIVLVADASGDGGKTTELRGLELLTRVGTGHKVSNSRVIHILTGTVTGTVTNRIGLEIENQTGGLTNYAIRTGTGLASFGDKVSAVAGFSSTDTTAAVNIAATGWTNTFSKNAVVYYDGISVTAKVYDNAGTAIYTNATALGGGSILLQPSGKVILSGTSVVGRAAPF